MLPGWLWEVHHLVEVHLEYGAQNWLVCWQQCKAGTVPLLRHDSWPGSQGIGTLSSHSEPHISSVSVTSAKDGAMYVK